MNADCGPSLGVKPMKTFSEMLHDPKYIAILLAAVLAGQILAALPDHVLDPVYDLTFDWSQSDD